MSTNTPEKRAPVQGYTPGVPWSLHLEAYDAYCKKYGAQPALIDLEGRGCRGGFGTRELDEFIPGWRDKVSEIATLKAERDRYFAERNACAAWRIEEMDRRDELLKALEETVSALWLQLEPKHGPQAASEYPEIKAARELINRINATCLRPQSDSTI